jgi:hypothetical protein
VTAFTLRPLQPEDAAWVAQHIAAEWGAKIVVAHGAVYRPAGLPGFIAEAAGEPVGRLTYHIAGDACEIVTLVSSQMIMLPGGRRAMFIDRRAELANLAARCRFGRAELFVL